jgi:hypothetical protein
MLSCGVGHHGCSVYPLINLCVLNLRWMREIVMKVPVNLIRLPVHESILHGSYIAGLLTRNESSGFFLL